jgi:drug/metabolite transporter (DMT)-like permease
LGPQSALAVLILSVGIILLALSGHTFNRQAVVLALLTGVTIAGYSFLSGLGIRKSQSLLAYIAWLEIATGLGMASVACVRRKSVLAEFARTQWRTGLIAGLLSVTGYAIALWAMSVLPMAPVVALRETSVVFAAIIGSVFLREGFAGRRVASAATVMVGIVLLSVGANAA